MSFCVQVQAEASQRVQEEVQVSLQVRVPAGKTRPVRVPLPRGRTAPSPVPLPFQVQIHVQIPFPLPLLGGTQVQRPLKGETPGQTDPREGWGLTWRGSVCRTTLLLVVVFIKKCFQVFPPVKIQTCSFLFFLFEQFQLVFGLKRLLFDIKTLSI